MNEGIKYTKTYCKTRFTNDNGVVMACPTKEIFDKVCKEFSEFQYGIPYTRFSENTHLLLCGQGCGNREVYKNSYDIITWERYCQDNGLISNNVEYPIYN